MLLIGQLIKYVHSMVVGECQSVWLMEHFSVCAGGGGAWEAPGPGPGTGRGREEQYAAGSGPRRGHGGGQEAALPAHPWLQLYEHERHVVSVGLPGE